MASKIRLDDGKALGVTDMLVGVKGAAKSYSVNDLWADVSLGLIAGVTRASGIGYNPDVDTATTPEDAWGGAGLYPWFSGATNLEIVSTSAEDSATGTGARSVSFPMLDASGNQITHTIAPNGLTAVPFPAAVSANNGGRVVAAGSARKNVGDLIIRDAGGGATRGIILASKGVMRQAPYTVPTGFVLLVRQILLAVDSPTGAVGKFASMETVFGSPAGVDISPLPIGNTNGLPYNHIIDPPIPVTAGTRLSLRIISASDNNTVVTAAWNGALVKL